MVCEWRLVETADVHNPVLLQVRDDQVDEVEQLRTERSPRDEPPQRVRRSVTVEADGVANEEPEFLCLFCGTLKMVGVARCSSGGDNGLEVADQASYDATSEGSSAPTVG
ncbi:MAG: hypothetical protein JWN04_1966 [Myxococcaceae bacterium]|nr:hypothetical protein [Myxococcaceae bacterium]